jgi:hypothetical protein
MQITVLMLIALFALVSPAKAQTFDPSYPVCLKNYGGGMGGGEFYECQFTSLPQCEASASGRAATCMVNPRFAGAPAAPAKRPHRRQRRVYGE